MDTVYLQYMMGHPSGGCLFQVNEKTEKGWEVVFRCDDGFLVLARGPFSEMRTLLEGRDKEQFSVDLAGMFSQLPKVDERCVALPADDLADFIQQWVEDHPLRLAA